ncbi:MAG: hypothetical protein K9I29_09140 [Bacteroidales bacterium]|nr:hypothetical protein [Bacteroidales bacterium]MCF8328442.1 hypothetical protein [Bacteroidales bacterium]
MFRLITLFLFLLSTALYAQDKPENCRVNDIRLMGNVRIVNTAPDLRVYISSSETFNSLEVEIVDVIPSICGQWRIIDRGEDFAIKIIDDPALADLIITIRDTREGKAFLKKHPPNQ